MLANYNLPGMQCRCIAGQLVISRQVMNYLLTLAVVCFGEDQNVVRVIRYVNLVWRSVHDFHLTGGRDDIVSGPRQQDNRLLRRRHLIVAFLRVLVLHLMIYAFVTRDHRFCDMQRDLVCRPALIQSRALMTNVAILQ